MRISLIIACVLFIVACSSKVDKTRIPAVKSTYPEKAKDMTIYEVNIRQHTPEGTFKAFQTHLPRLKELGVDMLWIMPVQPIGEKNRKGNLGSYYSIRDYKEVNPEFGTLNDFKNLVNEAHALGFQVILDWVPNHTSWDHTWLTDHPEYYMTDSAAAWVGKQLGVDAKYYNKSGTGNLVYEADWNDIALLNLYHEGARSAMVDAMKFWVTETGIDGFRADHAGHEIPLFFWEEATNALNPIKDLFWLAEWDEARMHTQFHATYEWSLLHLTEDVAKGHRTAEDLHNHILRDVALFGRQALRLNMINNHDENAWAGTVKERYGDSERAMAVFSFVAYGVPVLYSGQEVGLNKRLRFFEKDTITWDDPEQLFPFYKKLNELKANNPALWSGEYGGMPQKVEDGNVHVFSQRRRVEGNEVLTIINMSPKEQVARYTGIVGQYTDAFSGETIQVSELTLPPWKYYVLIK
jgi:glycosidase